MNEGAVRREPLTPSDIMALRVSNASLRGFGGGVDLGTPYIMWLPADQLFCLHAYGCPQAKLSDVQVLAECLRQERAEPGFIRRVLSAVEPPDAASLDPASRARWHSHQLANRANAQADADRRATESARRTTLINPTALDLEDL